MHFFDHLNEVTVLFETSLFDRLTNDLHHLTVLSIFEGLLITFDPRHPGRSVSSRLTPKPLEMGNGIVFNRDL
jgi:hypothetical protein